MPDNPGEDSMTRSPDSKKALHWVDWIVLLVVAAGSILSVNSMLQYGVLGVSLTDDPRLSWHIVRAAGLTAYALLTASTVWGLFLSSHIIKNWTPGPVSLLLHAAVSWLAVALGAVHAGALLFDTYYPYTVRDVLVPFVGPYRPFAVGLGIVAAWLIFGITISFSFRRLIGQRAWRWLHYTSYVAFALVTVHSFLSGTDMAKPGMVILVDVSVVLVAALLTWRVMQAMSRSDQKRRSP
jgi:sulfoxide reductase heme-binding subunit YedZ